MGRQIDCVALPPGFEQGFLLHFPFLTVVGEDHFFILMFPLLQGSEAAQRLLRLVSTRMITSVLACLVGKIHFPVRWRRVYVSFPMFTVLHLPTIDSTELCCLCFYYHALTSSRQSCTSIYDTQSYTTMPLPFSSLLYQPCIAPAALYDQLLSRVEG